MLKRSENDQQRYCTVCMYTRFLQISLQTRNAPARHMWTCCKHYPPFYTDKWMNSEVTWSPLKPPHRSTLLWQLTCPHPSRTTWVHPTALYHAITSTTCWFITRVCWVAHVCIALWWTQIDISNLYSTVPFVYFQIATSGAANAASIRKMSQEMTAATSGIQKVCTVYSCTQSKDAPDGWCISSYHSIQPLLKITVQVIHV